MDNWFIIYNGQRVGPMTKQEIISYQPTTETMVWRKGMTDWQPLYTVPELMHLLSQSTPPRHIPPQAAPYAQPAYNHDAYNRQVYEQQHGGGRETHTSSSGKDKTLCGILALLFGSLGVQYFYLGRIGAGFLTIFLNIITCGIWYILVFIQGIIMLAMSQEEFDRKFVYSKSTLPLF